MNNKKYLVVFDIETIPDVSICDDLILKEDPSVSGVNLSTFSDRVEFMLSNFSVNSSGSFIKHAFHQIVAIGYAVLSCFIDKDGYEVYNLQKVSCCSDQEFPDQEAGLIKAFINGVIKKRKEPKLVSFNGYNFDLPVIQYRAMKHRISVADVVDFRVSAWTTKYTQRYKSEFQCDIADILRFFSFSSSVKLDELCLALGLPGKIDPCGDKIPELYENKEMDKIKEYCEIDVLNTLLVYLRHSLFVGRMNSSEHSKIESQVRGYIESKSNSKNLEKFLKFWV